ncbi:MAG: hypothetical protein IKJ18_02200 [Bacteroidaceae bacterium]|nr:hypothetical protein [Bacteroidaceae bacterium]
MKQVNNTFSPRRLWMVMKRDITADGMLYLGIFLGMVVLLTFLQLEFFKIDLTNQNVSTFEYYIVNGYIDKAISQVSFGIWQISFPVLVLYLFIMTATLCNPMTKKKRSINYLMLPASCAEKYVSRILITIVATLCMAVLVAFLADLARMAIVATLPRFANIPAECNTFVVDDTLATLGLVFSKSYSAYEGVPHPLAVNYALVLFYVYCHSLILLGASIFRFYLARFAPLSVFIYLVILMDDMAILENLMLQHPVPTLVVFAILTLFNWWLAYYYFSHKMIVRRTGYIIKRKEVV